jgi:hypothetical protein
MGLPGAARTYATLAMRQLGTARHATARNKTASVIFTTPVIFHNLYHPAIVAAVAPAA